MIRIVTDSSSRVLPRALFQSSPYFAKAIGLADKAFEETREEDRDTMATITLDVDKAFLDRYLLGTFSGQYYWERDFFSDPDNYEPPSIQIRVQDKVFYSCRRTLSKCPLLKEALDLLNQPSVCWTLHEDPEGFSHFLSYMRDSRYKIPEAYLALDEKYQVLTKPVLPLEPLDPDFNVLPFQGPELMLNVCASETQELTQTFEFPYVQGVLFRKYCLAARSASGKPRLCDLKKIKVKLIFESAEKPAREVLFEHKWHSLTLKAMIKTFYPEDWKTHKDYLKGGTLFVPLLLLNDLVGGFMPNQAIPNRDLFTVRTQIQVVMAKPGYSGQILRQAVKVYPSLGPEHVTLVQNRMVLPSCLQIYGEKNLFRIPLASCSLVFLLIKPLLGSLEQLDRARISIQSKTHVLYRTDSCLQREVPFLTRSTRPGLTGILPSNQSFREKKYVAIPFCIGSPLDHEPSGSLTLSEGQELVIQFPDELDKELKVLNIIALTQTILRGNFQDHFFFRSFEAFKDIPFPLE